MSTRIYLVVLFIIIALVLLTYTIMLTIIETRRRKSANNNNDCSQVFSNKLVTWIKVYLAVSYILIIISLLLAGLIGSKVIFKNL